MSQAASGALSRPARGAVAFVYLAGVVQGVVMVSFAASSAVLRARHGFSDVQYGSIFVPQMTMAALAALAYAPLARRLDLRQVLASSFGAMALSQAALAASHFFTPGPAFAIVVVAASLMGLGAGLSAPPLNTYPQLFFPRATQSAVVAMHTVMGLGLAAGPLFVGMVATRGLWLTFPLGMLVICLVLLAVTFAVSLPLSQRPHEARERSPIGSRHFALFVALAALYALAEGGYSNWAVLFLSEEKGLPVAAATFALAAFWLALSVGRLLVGFLVLRVPAERVYLVLPLLMAGTSFLLPLATTPERAALLFALAGLSCSAFYPLTVALASKRFPGHLAAVSAVSYAALVGGLGLGSFLTGILRTHLSFAAIYRWSAVAPLAALALGLVALAPGTADRRE